MVLHTAMALHVLYHATAIWEPWRCHGSIMLNMAHLRGGHDSEMAKGDPNYLHTTFQRIAIE